MLHRAARTPEEQGGCREAVPPLHGGSGGGPAQVEGGLVAPSPHHRCSLGWCMVQSSGKKVHGACSGVRCMVDHLVDGGLWMVDGGWWLVHLKLMKDWDQAAAHQTRAL